MRQSTIDRNLAWMRANLAAANGAGCIEWPFYCHPAGTPWHAGKPAAEVALGLFKGPMPTSPGDWVITQACTTKACVNPWHFYWRDALELQGDEDFDPPDTIIVR